MQLVSVAAIAENRVIGKDGAVPWPEIPEDVRQYRARVAEAPVILGRRTFESMRGNLPGARQIVVSRSLDTLPDPTAVVAGDVDGALAFAREFAGDGPAYVLGGGAIYELFQPHLDRMVLSHVDGSYEGDTRYPAWDDDEWTVVTETPYDRFTLREWARTDR
ncbi:dihydrofolate reductase [Halorubrum sp. JWXQ-INN 858]|uniref:dihydrofolate reductase n=1 Tax=Halorubrum sp. JWXQ-INN 858 TaxID=2690782 RepID=UPI0013FC6196|nr:dihydrofolate reductase [Halorubrum sp. JWXQ-INN 858]MWV65627.1 dihydrofolate reductase [Halorubrum sp. JWXQ-INN 858]